MDLALAAEDATLSCSSFRYASFLLPLLADQLVLMLLVWHNSNTHVQNLHSVNFVEGCSGKDECFPHVCIALFYLAS